MMEKSKKYVSDILTAINLIENFVADTADFVSYQNDLKTQSAVERQLAIVGEALNKFLRINPDIDIENSKQIVGFRNRLIHAYGSIDNAIVWVIINRYLISLKNELERFKI